MLEFDGLLGQPSGTAVPYRKKSNRVCVDVAIWVCEGRLDPIEEAAAEPGCCQGHDEADEFHAPEFAHCGLLQAQFSKLWAFIIIVVVVTRIVVTLLLSVALALGRSQSHYSLLAPPPGGIVHIPRHANKLVC